MHRVLCKARKSNSQNELKLANMIWKSLVEMCLKCKEKYINYGRVTAHLHILLVLMQIQTYHIIPLLGKWTRIVLNLLPSSSKGSFYHLFLVYFEGGAFQLRCPKLCQEVLLQQMILRWPILLLGIKDGIPHSTLFFRWTESLFSFIAKWDPKGSQHIFVLTLVLLYQTFELNVV